MATRSNPASPSNRLAEDPERIVPVYVWELPVRLVHWGLVITLVVLTITGSYMHDPYLVVHGSRAWVMGWMRFIHELSGFFLIAIFVPRIYWFFAGNRWASWRAWLPHTARQWASFKSMVAYYAFRRRKPFDEIGHNSLAAMAYMGVFSLVALEFISGLVLFSVVEGGPVSALLRGMDSALDRHSMDTFCSFPGHVYIRWVSHPSRLQRRAGGKRGKERRNGEHLHWLEVCSPAPY